MTAKKIATEIRFGGSIDASLRRSTDKWQRSLDKIADSGKRAQAELKKLEKKARGADKSSAAYTKLQKKIDRATRAVDKAAGEQKKLVKEYGRHKRAADKATRASQRLGDSARSTMGRVDRLAGSIQTAFVGAFTGAVAGMGGLLAHTAQWGRQVQLTADTIGATPESVQRIQAAFSAVGVDAETTNDALVDISERLGEAATDTDSSPFKSLRDGLGMSASQIAALNDMSADAQVEALIRATQGMDAGQANFRLREILGDEAARGVMQYRELGADAFRERIGSAHAVDIAKLNELNAKFTELMQRGQTLAAEFFTPIVDAVLGLVGDGDTNMDDLARSAHELGEDIAEWVPKIADMAKRFFEAVGGVDGIVTGLKLMGGLVVFSKIVSLGAGLASALRTAQALVTVIKGGSIASGLASMLGLGGSAAAASTAAATGTAAAAASGTAAAGAGTAAAGAGAAGAAGASGLAAAALPVAVGAAAVAAGAVIKDFWIDDVASGERSFAGESGMSGVLAELGNAIVYAFADDDPATSGSERAQSAAGVEGSGGGSTSTTTSTTNNTVHATFNVTSEVSNVEEAADQLERRMRS